MSSPELVRGHAASSRVLRTAGVLGLGTALPPTVVDNAPIAARLGVEPEWITRRTGILRRRQLQDGERLTDVAVSAGRRALTDADVPAGAVDLVIAASGTQDEVMPNMAPLVAGALGAQRAGAFDVGAACTGFVSALALGAGWIECGRGDVVLVIGADALSRRADPDDRSTAALFGDGAGAMLITAEAAGAIGPAVLGADGARGELVGLEHGEFITMNGHETFKHAVARLAEATEQAAAAAGLALGELDLFIYHQANRRILAALAERLAIDPDRVVDAIADVGNTSAASIPLALQAARSDGRLSPGHKVLLGAVGSGFTWGTTIVEWGMA